MSKFLAALLLEMALVSGRVMASPPAPAQPMLWTAANLKLLDHALCARKGGTGAAYEWVLKAKTYGALLLHREVTGEPELHVRMNDFFVVVSGEAEIEVGGRVTGDRVVAPDERRGQKLVGGAFYKVEPGDVMFVPANHWLQVFVPKGRVLRTIIIKAQ